MAKLIKKPSISKEDNYYYLLLASLIGVKLSGGESDGSVSPPEPGS